MADLGAMALWIGLALSGYAAIGSVLGQLRGAPALVESARRSVYVLVLAMLVATLSLIGSFINRDFEVAYVAAHSNLAMPDIYTWVAFYAGNEGSLLYIAFALSVMAAIALRWAPASTRETLPYTTAALMVIQTFFIAVMGFMANPFDKLPLTPLDGEGINPLLTHFGMFFHPPALMAGLIGISLPLSFALSVMAAIALRWAPASTRDTLPYTTAALMVIQTFFIAVMGFMANPFDKLPLTPPDGEGINPLLTHFGMFFHPPALMAGLIGISLPLSFALGALVGGKGRDEWVDAGRVWGLIAWVLLAGGLLLGSWWAYTILGWGGFWFWDPVENAAFMPWLVLTAFVHSVMVQKRRGMFRMWNIVLINVAFGLALYGMFMNRGGPTPSVHSFGASDLGWVFLMFLAVGVIVPFGVFFWRYGLLKSAQNLDAMLSREAAFLVNNLLLLGIAFVTLWGTVYPLFVKLGGGEEITIARPFYDQVNGPLLLALICLMGVGPLLPWRRANWGSLRRALLLPGSVAAAVVVILLLLVTRSPYALIGFGLSGMVAAGIGLEWWRGMRSRHRSTGENYPLALGRLIAANRPRYGGYIVHLAVVMVGLGVLGGSLFEQQRDVVLSPGESYEIADYRLTYMDTRQEVFSDRTEYLATLEVYRDGELLEVMTARRSFYPAFNMASTLAAIRSTPVEDFYVVPSENRPDGAVGFRILVNPLVWWMWAAGPVLIIGTVVSLWPERRRERAAAGLAVRRAAAATR